MRWRTGRESDNVEDRRGLRAAPTLAGGGIGTIILVLLALFFDVDPGALLQSRSPGGVSSQQSAAVPPGQDESRKFVSVVLAETEDTWRDLFRRMGGTYQDPKLVLFTGAVQSACGFAQAAVGPFYCPADQKVYIDLGFYQDLKNRFHAPGDFAQAYVIAHEIGHHVQNLLGISDQVEARRRRSGAAEANALSVRLELQADCLAGVWAYHAHKARQILESGDIEEGLNAASAIGDDRLQMQAKGYVAPDSFTHGSSAQRVRWFKRGIASGDLRQCDTFSTAPL
ncbi:MAG: flagellar biosynthesis protein FlgM [Candidatus Contendobacter sp.]|nr:MAG: flagellar biosynthesis protein FlgM [Candidatus Contendobacter sp.]